MFFYLLKYVIFFSFKNFFEDYSEANISDFLPLIYKSFLEENHFQKMFDKLKRSVKSGLYEPQIMIKTPELEYSFFYKKEELFKNLFLALNSFKTLLSFTSGQPRQIKIRENMCGSSKLRKASIVRKSTFKKGEGKKSVSKINLKNSSDKESPSQYRDDFSDKFNESPSISPVKTRMSIFTKKKMSEER